MDVAFCSSGNFLSSQRGLQQLHHTLSSVQKVGAGGASVRHDMNELLRHNFTPMYLLIQASLMMNRHAFNQSFLAEIMTRALTKTPGEHSPKDVETLHDVMKGEGT